MITFATAKRAPPRTGYQRRDAGRPEPACRPRAVILTPASPPLARAIAALAPAAPATATSARHCGDSSTRLRRALSQQKHLVR